MNVDRRGVGGLPRWRAHHRGTTPARGLRRSIPLQLYSASNILGVGVFTLPFLIPIVGLMPAIIAPFVAGMMVSPLYQRLVRAAHEPRPDVHHTEGSDPGLAPSTLAGPVRRIGGGVPASVLGKMAASLRGIPTMVVYLSIGEVAATMIHHAVASLESATMVLTATLVISAVAPVVMRRGALPIAVLRLVRFWSAALLVVDLGQLGGFARSVVLVMGVTAGIVDMGSQTDSLGIGGRRIGGMRPQHSGATAILAVQLTIMAVIAITAIVIVGGPIEPQPLALVPTPKEGIVAAGVVLFALTGTGHVNIATYPLMRTQAGISTVIDGALRISVIVQVTWLMVTAATVSTSTLARLDGQKSFSTVGIADAITETAPGVGHVVLAVGAVLVLFGLSSSCNTCAETLATEFTTYQPDRTRPGQVAVIIATAVTALALAGSGISATGIIAIGGLGGGMLIIFVLPILAESDPRRHRRRRNQAISVTGLVVTIAAVGEILDGSGPRLTGTLLLGTTVIVAIIRASANIERTQQPDNDVHQIRSPRVNQVTAEANERPNHGNHRCATTPAL